MRRPPRWKSANTGRCLSAPLTTSGSILHIQGLKFRFHPLKPYNKTLHAKRICSGGQGLGHRVVGFIMYMFRKLYSAHRS